MDQHYFLVCPVNSQNEEKLAGQGEARLRLLTNATYPRPGGGHAAVHLVSDCQRHALQYPTCGVPSLFDFPKRRRAKRKVQQYEQYYYQNRMVERMYSYFFISDKVHVYSGEGRKTAAQHVMNDIDQPTMLEYILASMRTRLCVLAPRLSQGTMGWPFCRQLRSVCSHSGPTCP